MQSQFDQIFAIFSDTTLLINVFIKLFAIAFSFMFFIYAFIMRRQVEEITSVIQTNGNVVVKFISFAQLIISIILLVSAFLFL